MRTLAEGKRDLESWSTTKFLRGLSEEIQDKSCDHLHELALGTDQKE